MSIKGKTKEPQYNILFDVKQKHGISSFGLMANESWNEDPRRTLFTLARYKFVSKMLAGLDNVLEVGCADAFGTRLVQQTVNSVTVTDFDPIFIEDINSRLNKNWKMDVLLHDILSGPVQPRNFSGVFALDVLEHISSDDEGAFIRNMVDSIHDKGVLILGMPSLESQTYASKQSKIGHINCKSGDDFKRLLEKYFHNVFLFSMNDEVIHTGYSKMAHYLIVLCCNKRS